MAIKDWTKSKKKKHVAGHEYRWFHKDKDLIMMVEEEISPIDNPTFRLKILDLANKNRNLLEEGFKSEKKAVRRAKQYMRKY